MFMIAFLLVNQDGVGMNPLALLKRSQYLMNLSLNASGFHNNPIGTFLFKVVDHT
jgi:hypothetical protein